MMPSPDHRYSRQILFKPIGEEGQARLGRSTVGLLGLGALGSSIAEMVVRAGVGRLIAVDRDVIETGNLHRQGLYLEEDAIQCLPKAVAAGRRLQAMNPDVEVDARVENITAHNAENTFSGCDVILDGTDSFEIRYLLNDLAVQEGIPWIYGACVGARGMTATVIPGQTPCLRCLFPEPPTPGSQETCDTAGIIAPAAVQIAAIQVAEALKILVGSPEAIRPSLLSIDLWSSEIVEVGSKGAQPRDDCPTCVQRRFDFLDGANQPRATSLCGRDSVQIVPGSESRISFEDLQQKLGGIAEINCNDFVLTATVEDLVITVFRDGRALVKGTTDVATAQGAYARYVGA